MVLLVRNKEEKSAICKEILEDLPDWFGIPESTEEYIMLCTDLPLWVDVEDDKKRGFIALKETSPYTVEVCVMGVKKEFHRKGIGKELFKHMYDYAKKHNYEFIQVKTVKEGMYTNYDLTNNFYKTIGFKELECFPTIWDEANPCQIYVMSIK